jgi:hypothetical protein
MSTDTTEAGLREKLKDIEDRIAQAREDRVPLKDARDKARDEFASSDDQGQEGEAFGNAEAAVRALGEHDDMIAELQNMQVGTLRMLGKDGPAPLPPGDNGNQPAVVDQWDSSRLFADEDTRRMLAHASTTKARIGPVELGPVISRDALAADISGSPDMRRAAWLGVLPQLRRVLRVLDLIPKGTMDANVLPYTIEEGSFATAAETKEGESKPEGAVTFTDGEATAQTIAHWMKIRKQSLSDYAALRSIVDSRLRYGVERRLETEVVSGNGTAPNLQGIIGTTGIGAVAFAATAQPMDLVLQGITTVFLADGVADGIALHPKDWEKMLSAKATAKVETTIVGSAEYIGGGPFTTTAQTLWGVPLVASASVPEKTCLVADFAVSCQLFIREGVNVLMSDSDQDDFIKNRVTMLAEMRAAFAVFRPAAIVNVKLG